MNYNISNYCYINKIITELLHKIIGNKKFYIIYYFCLSDFLVLKIT